MRDIVLALGGGGVKGHAHIGVLRVLDREGYRVRGIAGTSAGGLWGSFYAAGLSPDEIQSRMLAADVSKLYARRSEDGPAMLGVSGIEQLLRRGLGDCSFEDLKIPFLVTAVDLETAEAVLLNQGRVVEAILATIAVPGVFPPVRLDGRLLVDGGVLDPVPVRAARQLAPDLPVVAVVLSPPLNDWVTPNQPRLLNSLPFLSNYLARLRIAQALNIFLRSVDIAGAMLTELRLELERPDVIIRPAVPHIGLLDHVDINEVAALGEAAAEQALPDLERAFNWRSRLFRRLSRPRRNGPTFPYRRPAAYEQDGFVKQLPGERQVNGHIPSEVQNLDDPESRPFTSTPDGHGSGRRHGA